MNARRIHSPAPLTTQLGLGTLYTHRCLIPKLPRAERADLGMRPLPTQSWGLATKAGPGYWG